MMRHSLSPFMIFVFLTGIQCHSIYPFHASSSVSDGSLSDQSIFDDTLQPLPSTDSFMQDFLISLDNHPLDQNLADNFFPPDMAPDTNSSAIACKNSSLYASNEIPLQSSKIIFAFCKLDSQKNACGIQNFCNRPAWEACTPSQYKNHAKPPPTSISPAEPKISFWIAGCLEKTGNAFSDPIDSSCSSACNPTSDDSPANHSWKCSDGEVWGTSMNYEVGITTNISCRMIGKNSSNNAAYWVGSELKSLASGVVCCQTQPL